MLLAASTNAADRDLNIEIMNERINESTIGDACWCGGSSLWSSLLDETRSCRSASRVGTL